MKTIGLLYTLTPGLGKMVYRLFYRYVSKIDRAGEATFLNFGYADLESGAPLLPLRSEDEFNRYCIQLYHHIAGAVELNNRDVLEVGCGRGGGSDYIARCLNPATMTGLDLVGKAIEFCSRHHLTPNLKFRQGDAEYLPFEDHSFDAVVNVESSHLYGSMSRFLAEVFRVLRPKGHFLLADFRDRDRVAALRSQLQRAGFTILRERAITRNVVQALDLDHDRRVGMIKKQVPWFMRKALKQFAATRGTSYYESFRQGRWEYLSFVLQKP